MPKRALMHNTRVAGYRYTEGAAVSAHTLLHKATDVRLVREPDNPYDANAIALYTQYNMKLGYIPRVENAYLAFLLDLGIEFECWVTGVDTSWHTPVQIHIGIVLGWEPFP